MKHTAQSLIDAGYPVVWIARDNGLSDLNQDCVFVTDPVLNEVLWMPHNYKQYGPFANGAECAPRDDHSIEELPWNEIGPGEKLKVDLRKLGDKGKRRKAVVANLQENTMIVTLEDAESGIVSVRAINNDASIKIEVSHYKSSVKNRDLAMTLMNLAIEEIVK